MIQVKAKILENKRVAENFYRMRIESPYLSRRSKPGQFVEAKTSDRTDPLLRRPLGIHRISRNGIDLLYEVVGKGTAMLSEKKIGAEIDLVGPLGNGFYIAPSTRAAIIVAGGNGVAPLVALAERLSRKGCKISVVEGAKKKSHILCENELKFLGCTVKIATEDGSKGYKGLATDILQGMLAPSYALRATIYACGPVGMLKEIAQIARIKKMACQVSLEERMACGVGVCLGCPVKLKGGEYKMVCKDGPVFNAEDIAW